MKSRSEGRGPRWMDRVSSIHLGSLPLATLPRCSAGNDKESYRIAASMLPPSTVMTAAVVFSAWAR
jgi:hypothetical protein